MRVKFVPLQKSHWPWISARANPEITPRTKGIVALDENGIILACAVFDTWTYTSGQVHVAIENKAAIRYGFIEVCMGYFFNTCDRKVMIGLTPANNLKSLKFNRHLGFTELFRVKDGYDHGVDYVVQELRKEDCRWIIHGKENSRRA